MQIVIDISKEDYKFIKEQVDKRDYPDMSTGKAIAHGTPLPKGYGRLIDAEEYEISVRKHYFDNSTVVRCTEIALDNAPTILEADKENK